MFVVLLKFSKNKGQASQFMESHNAWLKRGFDDGVFLLAGTIQPKLGGGILAHGVSPSELYARVRDDPFVIHDVVNPEILEITPGRTDARLDFLRAAG